ncbi:universal stress protein [Falsiroseomonas tokyonensis]|uniref:Universal stress protein n=1 Tax=Falsiroseomonas tokyonensis TaxID=430521 RepID=A0ABV7C377_9PROT|nr:universal stress protein [Falsiroseomonas tokyonensis]MBU8541415.1 universal stress protein [Falsiroseomonas tokyonensis]
MHITDILVHLDATAQGRQRLRLAADLARRHQAHLTGLHVYDILMPLVVGDAGGSAALLGEIMERMRQDALAAATEVEAAFRERLRQDALAGEWRLVEGAAPEQVALHGRYADLLVVGQEDGEGAATNDGAVIAAALFSSGRPVLIMPHSGRFDTIGRRVLIGWNAGREAARAVHDALPLMAGAESVTVLAVNPRTGIGRHGEEPGADIARHLARHGLPVTVERCDAAEIGVGDILLNRAADLGTDLIVVGAYGHARIRELVLGGVTRTLLRQMTVPVLMSH